MRQWRIGVGGALLCAATGLSAQTLEEAVEAAWRLTAGATSVSSGVGEAEAQRDIATQWLVGSPSVTLSQSSDRLGRDEGSLTREIELEAPIWRWGQRASRHTLAEAGLEAAKAEVLLLRWQVAGEVREAVWTAAFGALDLETAKRRLEVAERIEQEVSRHVAVGDLAKSDLFLVLSEKAAARVNVADAEQRAREASQRYAVLTGLQSWTLPPVRTELRSAPIDRHPAVASATAARRRAERALDDVINRANEPPSLIIGAERDRDRYGAPVNTTLRVGIKVPFGGSNWNQANMAAANAERSRAELNDMKARRAVDSEILVARTALQVAESTLQVAIDRHQAAEEHASLLRKGFSLGETGLAFLLRGESLLLDAKAGVARQELQVRQAQSRFEHSLGIFP